MNTVNTIVRELIDSNLNNDLESSLYWAFEKCIFEPSKYELILKKYFKKYFSDITKKEEIELRELYDSVKNLYNRYNSFKHHILNKDENWEQIDSVLYCGDAEPTITKKNKITGETKTTSALQLYYFS